MYKPARTSLSIQRANLKFARSVFALIILWLFIGCAGRSALMTQVRTELATSKTDKAYQTYKSKIGTTERVDELLNLGILALEAGDYSGAIKTLDEADRISDLRLTKSLSREATSLLVSDKTRAYQGTVFDKAMLHYYKALAYLGQNENNSAVVEGRRISTYLEVNSRESKHSYKDDAFLQYFSGSLYESFGQDNDALISYKRAREIYNDYYGISEPDFLCPVTYRAAKFAGISEAVQELDSLCPDAKSKVNSESGRVIVLCEAGIAPPIRENNIVIPILTSDNTNFVDDDERYRFGERASRRYYDHYEYHDSELKYLLRIALPYYEDYSGTTVSSVTVRDAQNQNFPAELAEDCASILRKDLDDRQPAILTRAIIRGIVKYAATQTAEEVGNKESKGLGTVLGILTNAVGAITENADTRSWETLPEKIYAADFELPPGEHELRAVFHDNIGGTLYRHDFPKITVKKGEVQILRVRYTK